MINSINSILSEFSNVRVLLLGDIMLDKYVYGNIERISPESPVPVLLHKDEKDMLGGAGNVYRNLIALNGRKHVFLSAVGNDEHRFHIIELLKDIKKNAKGAEYHLFVDSNRKTTLKLRLTAQKQQIIRYDVETASPFKPDLQEKILKKYVECLKNTDIVVLSDYNKGFFSREFTQNIIKLAKKAGKKVLIDPKNSDFSVYSGADYVTPNRKEFIEASGQPISTIDDITKAAKALCKKHSIKNIIVTLGEDGILFVPKDGKPIHSKLESGPDVFDVSGAGDTVLSVLALSIACSAQMPQILILANIAAQIAISKSGTAIVKPEEIIHFIHNRTVKSSVGNLLNKIVTLPQAKQIVQAWKNSGETVCFTNGCFDLLHYGHISSFLQARNNCDRLIVALNSDLSVKKNKGSDRPIQDEKTRASLLAVLQCIDIVIIFDETSPLKLVKELRPDIIAKEGYSLDKWAEARFVQSYGGKVVFLKKEKGYSTSTLVKKMKSLKEGA